MAVLGGTGLIEALLEGECQGGKAESRYQSSDEDTESLSMRPGQHLQWS